MASVWRNTDGHDPVNDVSDAKAQPPAVSTDSILEEPSSKIWIPYLNLANKYDNDLVHNWRDDMDSLLIFAALFSASVTAFVIESYNNLLQDTGEVTISVLLQISQQLANGTHAPAAVRPSFQPASIDVAVNILWFLSLAFSLTCALAAVLVRQWARQYLRFPRSFSSTSEQARARQFVFENMEWWKMDVVVETIPVLLHISLILFFIGLLLFVRAVNFTLAVYLLCFSVVGGAAYTLLTITPLVFYGCPYKTPFTSFSGLCGTLLNRSMSLVLRSTWRFIIVILAFLDVFLLSPLVRLWLPSFGFPGRAEAMELPEPAWSTVHRFAKHLGGIQPSFQNIDSQRRKIHSFVTSPWTSAIHSLHRARKHLSGAVLNHCQAFHDELTPRDARALQWTLECSKRDTDLFTIVSSVPAFVQYYESNPDVCPILWQTGVVSHASRLLRSCAIDGGREIHSVLASCFESITCLVPCSTHSMKGDRYTLEFGLLSVSDLLRELLSVIDLTQESLAPVLLGTVSNLVLRQIYALETSFRDADEEGFWQQYNAKKSSILVFIEDLQSWIWHADSAAPFEPIDDQLWTLWAMFMTEPRSPDELYNKLETFRSSWVTLWLNSSLLPLPFHGLLLNNLCDGATHLQKFPHATRDSQRAVFVLFDRLFRTLHGKEFVSSPSKRHSMTLVYSMVLFGQAPKETAFINRYRMLGYFVERVHVVGIEGQQFPASGDSVVITFDVYTKTLNELVFSIQRGKVDTMGILQRHGFMLDASADAIQNIISCRLNNFGSCDKVNHFLIDATHLTTLRASRKHALAGWLWEWDELVQRTAKVFGYSFQLEESYNIDMHAELLCYDLSAEPLLVEDNAPFGVDTR